MNKIEKYTSIIIGAIIVLLSIIVAPDTNALSSEEIFRRILINNIETCYKNAFVDSIEAETYYNFDSLMRDGYKQAGSTQHGVMIPDYDNEYNHMSATDKDDGGRLTSCYALFAGDPTGLGTLDGNMKGLFDIYNIAVPTGHNDMATLDAFMSDVLQYEVNTESASSTQYCYTVYVKEATTAAQPVSLGSYCRNEDNFPITAYGENLAFSGGDGNADYTATIRVEQVTQYNYQNPNKLLITVTSNTQQCYDGSRSANQSKCSTTMRFSQEVPTVGTTDATYSVYWYNHPQIYVEISEQSGDSNESRKVTYKKKTSAADGTPTWKNVIARLTGQSEKIAFSDADKYDFYLQYLTKNYGKSGTSIGSDLCEADKPGALVDVAANKYYIYIGGKGWCLANLDNNKVRNNMTMSVFSESGRYTLSNVIKTLPELIELMGKLDYSDDEDLVDIDSPGQVDEDELGDDAVQDPCYNAGIEGMSWILCPSLNNMVSATDGISAFINDWLEVDSEYYSDTSSARETWGYFRDMANIAVIIVLLVIIISQITGYGIDNYGIKKMLPRLLIMAVLINLSFIVCQLAVDISNILGTGLNDMFQSIGRTISDKVGAEGVTAGIVDAIFIALGAAGAVAAPLITIGTLTGGFSSFGPMAIIFIVLMVVTALIAVLMFFLSLGARFIIVILFTAISPLAFACYILPNTQSLFKKWWDVFKTALIIYPICGALYGVSFIIRGIIFTTGDVKFSMAMIAIAAPFLPFLVLPKLLKSAIAGLGVVGGALSGIKSGIKSGFSKGEAAIQNTASFKAAQEQGQRNLNYKTAGFKYDRKAQEWKDNSENIHGFGRFLRGGKLGMSQARGRVLADERARVSEGGLMGAGFEAGMVAQKKAAESEEIGNWETLLKDQTNDGANEGLLFQKYHEFMGDGNKYGARAVARIAGRRKDTAARFLDEFNKTDFSANTERGTKARTAASSVAKEIAEGANSRMYLSAAPLKFDFASQINKNGENANFKYSGDGGWLSQKEEKTLSDGTKVEVTMADNAMNNYVTDSSELVGVKSSSLSEINYLIQSGGISKGEAKRLEILATETIANRDKGPWDSTKAEELCKMSNGAFTFEDGQIIDNRKGVQQPSNEGGVLNIRDNNGGSSKIILGSTDEEVRRAMSEFDQQQRNNPNWPGNK